MTSSGPPATAGLRERARWPIGSGLVMIAAGCWAIVAPRDGGIVIGILVAWVFILGGAAHLLLGRHSRNVQVALLELLLAMLALVAGGLLLANPPERLATLTTGLGAYLFVQGVLDVVASWGLGSVRGAGWLMVDGIVSVVVAIMIWKSWPASGPDTVGALVGISLVTSGVARVMLART